MRIFISYRRKDSQYLAADLRDVMVRHFGPANVFVDSEAIPIGVDFTQRIGQELQRADAVLVLVGPAWKPARLKEPADPVRFELATAHQFSKKVVPVLHSGTTMPAMADLPADLRWFCTINAFRVGEPERYRSDIAQLARTLASDTPVRYEPNPYRVRFMPGILSIGVDAIARILRRQTGLEPYLRPGPQQLVAFNGNSSIVLGQIIGQDGYDRASAIENPVQFAEQYTGRPIRDASVQHIFGEPGLRMELDEVDAFTYLRSSHLALLASRCDIATTDAIVDAVAALKPTAPTSIKFAFTAPIPLTDGFNVTMERLMLALVDTDSDQTLLEVYLERDVELDALDDVAGAKALIPEGASCLSDQPERLFGSAGGHSTLCAIRGPTGRESMVLTGMAHIGGKGIRATISHHCIERVNEKRTAGLLRAHGYRDLAEFLPYLMVKSTL